jgi:hypothetical protein
MQQDVAGVGHVEPSIKARKRFFLKKEARTFAHWPIRQSHRNSLTEKSFLVLFFKKEPFLPALKDSAPPS